MSSNNPHLDHRIATYLNPSPFKIIIAYAATKSMTRSKIVNEAIENFIEKNFNEAQKNQFIALYNKMTPEQRRDPSKYWESL